MTQDLTNGNPLKLIISFSLPLFLGNVFQQLYSMADTIIVGRTINVDALAAVGATGALNFLVIGFVMGITSGFSVITAQRFGAGDSQGVRRSIAASIVLCSIISIIVTLISFFGAESMLNMMKTPDNIMKDAHLYISIIFIGVSATMFYNLLSNILRALGDSKSPLLFLVIASLLNIVLDLLFIMWLKMGVAGAAWATVIAQAVSGLLCLLYIYKKMPSLHLHKEDWRFDWSFYLKHLKIGLPMAFQFSITAIGVMVVQTALNSFGSSTVAAFTAASKIDQIVQQPMLAFGTTMATYCAQNYGAGKIERIKIGVRQCTIFSCVITGVLSVGAMLFGRTVVQLFVSAEEVSVLNDAQTYLRIVSIFYISLALLFIYRNSLQGIGKITVPVLAGVCEVIARVLAAAFLAGPLGYVGVCLTDPLAWIGAAIPLCIAYFYHLRKMLKGKDADAKLCKKN